MSIRIEPMKPSHLLEVARICHAQLQPMSWREVADHLTYRRGIAVALSDDRVVGFTVAVWFAGASTLWLDLIAVDPKQAKSGIGRALIAELEKAGAAAGFEKLELATDISNEAAIRFYERLGYGRAPVPPMPGKVGFHKHLPAPPGPRSDPGPKATQAFGSRDASSAALSILLKARKLLLTAWILTIAWRRPRT